MRVRARVPADLKYEEAAESVKVLDSRSADFRWFDSAEFRWFEYVTTIVVTTCSYLTKGLVAYSFTNVSSESSSMRPRLLRWATILASGC